MPITRTSWSAMTVDQKLEYLFNLSATTAQSLQSVLDGQRSVIDATLTGASRAAARQVAQSVADSVSAAQTSAESVARAELAQEQLAARQAGEAQAQAQAQAASFKFII